MTGSQARIVVALGGGVGIVVIVGLLLGPGGLLAGPEALDAPHYANQTAASGLDHRYDGEFEFFVGGGVSS